MPRITRSTFRFPVQSTTARSASCFGFLPATGTPRAYTDGARAQLSTAILNGLETESVEWPSSRLVPRSCTAAATVDAGYEVSESVWQSCRMEAARVRGFPNLEDFGSDDHGIGIGFPSSRITQHRAVQYPMENADRGYQWTQLTSFFDSRMQESRAINYPSLEDFDGPAYDDVGLDFPSSRFSIPRVTGYPVELMPRGGSSRTLPNADTVKLQRWIAEVTEDEWKSSRFIYGALDLNSKLTRARIEDYPPELVEQSM